MRLDPPVASRWEIAAFFGSLSIAAAIATAIFLAVPEIVGPPTDPSGGRYRHAPFVTVWVLVWLPIIVPLMAVSQRRQQARESAGVLSDLPDVSAAPSGVTSRRPESEAAAIKRLNASWEEIKHPAELFQRRYLASAGWWFAVAGALSIGAVAFREFGSTEAIGAVLQALSDAADDLLFRAHLWLRNGLGRLIESLGIPA